MKFTFQGKRISGVLTILPQNEVDFDDEISNYKSSLKQMRKLKQVMGFGKRRIAKRGTGISDLAVCGFEKLFRENLLKKEDIGALLVVTQTPDYPIPPTANVIQGRLNLPDDVYCIEINNGCAGYIIGLIQAFQLLEHMEEKKVVLVAGDISSNNVSKKDRKHWPLMGDAVSITVIENTSDNEKIFGEVRMDGTRYDALIIPAGGIKMPYSAEVEKEYEDDEGNIRTLKDVVMNGGEVFNFSQVDVPPLIEDVIEAAGKTKEELDYYLFHQPNKFMVESLAGQLELPLEKVPSDIVSRFGNTSAASIATVICSKLNPDIFQKSFEVCMSGFGTGLAGGALVMKLGPLSFCDFTELREE